MYITQVIQLIAASCDFEWTLYLSIYPSIYLIKQLVLNDFKIPT